jgi:hypothetical protein
MVDADRRTRGFRDAWWGVERDAALFYIGVV